VLHGDFQLNLGVNNIAGRRLRGGRHLCGAAAVLESMGQKRHPWGSRRAIGTWSAAAQRNTVKAALRSWAGSRYVCLMHVVAAAPAAASPLAALPLPATPR
jgi:hypothetical protein